MPEIENVGTGPIQVSKCLLELMLMVVEFGILSDSEEHEHHEVAGLCRLSPFATEASPECGSVIG
jgi:hypothetical protein